MMQSRKISVICIEGGIGFGKKEFLQKFLAYFQAFFPDKFYVFLEPIQNYSDSLFLFSQFPYLMAPEIPNLVVREYTTEYEKHLSRAKLLGKQYFITIRSPFSSLVFTKAMSEVVYITEQDAKNFHQEIVRYLSEKSVEIPDKIIFLKEPQMNLFEVLKDRDAKHQPSSAQYINFAIAVNIQYEKYKINLETHRPADVFETNDALSAISFLGLS